MCERLGKCTKPLMGSSFIFGDSLSQPVLDLGDGSGRWIAAKAHANGLRGTPGFRVSSSCGIGPPCWGPKNTPSSHDLCEPAACTALPWHNFLTLELARSPQRCIRLHEVKHTGNCGNEPIAPLVVSYGFRKVASRHQPWSTHGRTQWRLIHK